MNLVRKTWFVQRVKVYYLTVWDELLQPVPFLQCDKVKFSLFLSDGLSDSKFPFYQIGEYMRPSLKLYIILKLRFLSISDLTLYVIVYIKVTSPMIFWFLRESFFDSEKSESDKMI